MIEHGKFTHTYEGQIGYGEKSKKAGFQGYPVSLLMGGEYKLNDNTDVNYSMKIAEHVEYGQTVAHKLNDKLKVSVNQEFDSSKMTTPEPIYKMGFAFDYTL